MEGTQFEAPAYAVIRFRMGLKRFLVLTEPEGEDDGESANLYHEVGMDNQSRVGRSNQATWRIRIGVLGFGTKTELQSEMFRTSIHFEPSHASDSTIQRPLLCEVPACGQILRIIAYTGRGQIAAEVRTPWETSVGFARKFCLQRPTLHRILIDFFVINHSDTSVALAHGTDRKRDTTTFRGKYLVSACDSSAETIKLQPIGVEAIMSLYILSQNIAPLVDRAAEHRAALGDIDRKEKVVEVKQV